MGLFDKIKKAINDSSVVDSAKQKAKDLMQNQDNSKTNDVTQNASFGNAEPELAQFYKLYAESVKSKKPEVAKEKGIAAITEFINVYTPSLNFLSDKIKEAIWNFTLQQGINCNYTPKNDEDKNALLHFVYSMQKVCDVEDLEEKVIYLWERATKYFDPRLENDLLYTKDVFGKSLKRFKIIIDYFPSNKKVCDETFFKKCSCEHGDCVVCKDAPFDKEKLFFTCGESASCDKKEDYKIENLIDEGLMPALRARAIGVQTRKEDVYNVKAAELVLDTYAPLMKNRKIVEMMVKSIDIAGINGSSMVKYFVKLNELNFEFKIEKMPEYIKVLEVIGKQGLDIETADWLANPTLYDKEDITYIAREFAMFSNKRWVEKHIIDASVIDINEFCDENGCVKDGGIDGREGDTIYNIVQKWCDGNQNQEEFDKEKENARRWEICKNCARFTSCKTVGLLENCSGYIPKK